MSQVNFLFEYPHVGRDVVSQSAPGVRGPTLGPDPDVSPYDQDSGSDSEDYDESDSEWEEDDTYRGEIHDDWHPHAINFLAQVPQSDAAWSRYLNTTYEVHSLCHRLRFPFLCPGYKADFDWEKLLAECKWHLARACTNPPLASLFSLIFMAACHVALVDGCPRELVVKYIRSCIRQCGIWEYELTGPMLDRLREGAIKGIMILTEYSRVVGSRAHELPLHIPDCMQLFVRCTPACITYVKGRIPFTYRPTTLLQSDCLEIPGMVYELLGGPTSKWRYQDICRILQPDGVPLPLYRDICVIDVLEYDETDDEYMEEFVEPPCVFESEVEYAFRHPLVVFRGYGVEEL
ncbi:hypothetical protein ACHAPT_009918 [Fusarium lateritium]